MNISKFAILAFLVVSFSLGAPGVLVYSTELQDSFVFILESETADDTQIDLRDTVTGVRLTL